MVMKRYWRFHFYGTAISDIVTSNPYRSINFLRPPERPRIGSRKNSLLLYSYLTKIEGLKAGPEMGLRLHVHLFADEAVRESSFSMVRSCEVYTPIWNYDRRIPPLL